MKKIKLMFTFTFIAVIFYGCLGDHGSRHGRDTEQNTYKVARDTSKKIDTLHGVDTPSLDQTASGGTKLIKPDSNKNK